MAQAEAMDTPTEAAHLDAGSDEPEASTSGPASPSKSKAVDIADQQLALQAPAAGKKASKQGQDDFVSFITSKIDQLEKTTGPSKEEKEASKQRKKQLREVIKYVSDRNNTQEDRIEFLQQKYTSLVTEFLRVEKSHYDGQTALEAVTRERDKAQAELRKANVVRARLEELCRGLQREAKDAVDEARRMREEDAKAREALVKKFGDAIGDVNTRLEAQASERAKQLGENEELRGKLGDMIGQFDAFNKLLAQKDAEVALGTTRLEQQQALCDALAQKADMLEQANGKLMDAHKTMLGELEGAVELRRTNLALAEANKALRDQLDAYGTKFGSFQDTLKKSNDMFDGLRKELEAGTKARALLVRERDEARAKAANADASILALLAEQAALKKAAAAGGGGGEKLAKLRSQKEALEGLCRSLQAKLKAQAGSGASSSADTTVEIAAAVQGGAGSA